MSKNTALMASARLRVGVVGEFGMVGVLGAWFAAGIQARGWRLVLAVLGAALVVCGGLLGCYL